ncbi:MAG: DnaJ domain-containing protein [Halarcobacter sp.]
MGQLISSLIKWAIFFGILYLIFTNFGTFLIIIFIFVALGYYALYQFKQKLRQSQGGSSFRFTFNGQEFNNAGGSNFNFNEFEQRFRNGSYNNGFNTQAPFSEVQKAKDFFGFTNEPTKEEIKKRYKELAKKYHPDINKHGATLMQQLNHYKEILIKTYS